ncbi:MAG: hypothetical protein PWQ37_1985 [Candidatus Petromonas sp.]|jgi:hypothetical protein|nr:hypothetical protein [Candidatus Petromonas sp.]
MMDTNNQIRQLELAEARKRMGTGDTGMVNAGFTNISGANNMTSAAQPSLKNSATTGAAEIQNVKQKMNQSASGAGANAGMAGTTAGLYGMTSAATPSLSDSIATDNAEVQNVRQKMNTTSLY